MSETSLRLVGNILEQLGIDESRIRRASERIHRVMEITPKGENVPLYELARESAHEFLHRQRHHGKQDVILLDSVLSIGRRYKLVVQWVGYYKRYVSTKGFEHSLETLANLDLEDYRNYLRTTGVLHIPDQNRLESAIKFAKLFLRKYPKSSNDKPYGLFRWVEETEGWAQFLRGYLQRDEICREFTDSMLKAFNRPLTGERTLRGLAPFQYLRMQCGEDTLKPDRRVTKALKKLLGVPVLSPIECIVVASGMCKELGIKLVELDQVMVCEDYLSCEQKFETLLDEAER